jgi:hypothetical protein
MFYLVGLVCNGWPFTPAANDANRHYCPLGQGTAVAHTAVFMVGQANALLCSPAFFIRGVAMARRSDLPEAGVSGQSTRELIAA